MHRPLLSHTMVLVSRFYDILCGHVDRNLENAQIGGSPSVYARVKGFVAVVLFGPGVPKQDREIFEACRRCF